MYKIKQKAKIVREGKLDYRGIDKKSSMGIILLAAIAFIAYSGFRRTIEYARKHDHPDSPKSIE